MDSSSSVIEQRRLLALASVEWSFKDQPAMAQAQAVLAKIFWLHPDPELSRVCLLAADLRGLRSSSRADPGVIASALATRLRAQMLAAGAKSPPSFLDDFPGAPFMASADVCSVACAVGAEGLSSDALLEACRQGSLCMFEPGFFWTRHLRLAEAGEGALERRANQLLTQLRQARGRS